VLTLAGFFCSLAITILFLAGSAPLLASPALKRVNYAGREVPTAAGFLFVPTFVTAYVLLRLLGGHGLRHVYGAGEGLLVLVTGMGFLGLLDDLLGDRGTSGFVGHLRSALRGKLTTGFLKALGGFLIAVAASFPISAHVWDLFINGAIIALAANLFNLLDMRPGRALKVFFPALGASIAVGWRLGDALVPYMFSVAATALVLMPGDLAERFMLGDAGSNVLGATVGFGLAAGAGLWWRVGLLAGFAALNLLSEKVSFSSVIEGNRALCWLDGLGRKGETGAGANYN